MLLFTDLMETDRTTFCAVRAAGHAISPSNSGDGGLPSLLEMVLSAQDVEEVVENCDAMRVDTGVHARQQSVSSQLAVEHCTKLKYLFSLLSIQ